MKEQVVLVDTNDNEIGVAEKLAAHKKGLLHRAFSILIFNDNNEILLQQRAHDKYHSGGLWTNTCCSHPRPKESLEQAAHRRLQEEMGFDCSLRKVFSFIYKKDFANGLTEHEYDHVFVGRYNGDVTPDPSEVAQYKWVLWDDVKGNINKEKQKYTHWFVKIIEQFDKKGGALL